MFLQSFSQGCAPAPLSSACGRRFPHTAKAAQAARTAWLFRPNIKKSGPQQAADRPNCTETYFVFFGAFAVFVVLAAALAGFSALTSFTARLTGAFASFSTSVRTQSWFSPLTNSQICAGA